MRQRFALTKRGKAAIQHITAKRCPNSKGQERGAFLIGILRSRIPPTPKAAIQYMTRMHSILDRHYGPKAVMPPTPKMTGMAAGVIRL
jgi:hypothetical protein